MQGSCPFWWPEQLSVNPAGARENPLMAMQLSTNYVSQQICWSSGRAPGDAGPRLCWAYSCVSATFSNGHLLLHAVPGPKDVVWEPGPPREHWAVGLLSVPRWAADLSADARCVAAGRRFWDYCRACAVAGIFPSFCSRKSRNFLFREVLAQSGLLPSIENVFRPF